MLDGGKLLLEKSVLLAKLFIFFLETLRDVLQGNVALDLPLLILLDLCLQLGKLTLLALAESALRGSANTLSDCGDGERRNGAYLFCTRRPFASACGRHPDVNTLRVKRSFGWKPTSVSSAGATGGAVSFLGFLPGFGLAGMTHSMAIY